MDRSTRAAPMAFGSMPAFPGSTLPWLTVEQMRQVDQLMVEDMRISLPQTMENAGRHLAVVARAMLGGDAAGQRVHVLAGPGGNGGGGLVAARHLHAAGADVVVSMSGQPDGLSLVPVSSCGVPVSSDLPATQDADLVIDALLGYSQTGGRRGGCPQPCSPGRPAGRPSPWTSRPASSWSWAPCTHPV